MDIIRSILVILFLVFLFSTQNYFILISLGMNNIIICKPSERRALLSFKQHLRDPSDSLSSWSGENCCSWSGVVCSNTTDHHVVQLQLQELGLVGELNPSLLELKQLRHLDLSLNYFEGISIPDFLGSLQSLRYLSHLDLSWENLENASNWFHAVNMFPSLLVLRLSRCRLSDALPSISLSHVNFTSLEVLDLSYNNFSSTLPEWLYTLTNLQQLHLSGNSFQGTISASIGNLAKLTLLDLSANYQLEGVIPTALGNLCKLQKLDLSYNQLSGPLPNDQLGRLQNLDYLKLNWNSFSGSIPFSIGRLTLLTYLDLGRNELSGSVPESFGNLSKLETLLLSYNSLEGNVSEALLSTLTSLQEIELHSVVLKVSPEWMPPFQLFRAELRNCQLGPRFPNWIQTQKRLYSLDLSSNGILGTVPTWFWNLSSQFSILNLSHNHLNGELPKVLKTDSYSSGIYLNFNQFKGPLPRVAYGVVDLDLSNNLLSGSISAFLCNPYNKSKSLRVLDLSNNLISGDLSQCWFNWTSLGSLWLGRNHITGKIPSSMGSLLNLQSLHLGNNNLSGELPLSLRNCTWLKALDIGENMLAGRLPIWLGKSFPDLIVLRLRLNKFHGEIPQEFCDMTSLQMLDLAHNNLSGSIPRCFSNLSAMTTKQNSTRLISYTYSVSGGQYIETTSLVTKGRELEFSNTLRLVTNMDLSKNSLSGEIPEELTSLIGLRSLNLSENHFTGKMPENIGNMVLLDSIDFSNNNISGVIPQSILRLSFLSYLNVSYNNLSGKIPSSTQLQLLTELSFIGNQDLCGPPLKNCSGEEPTQKPSDFGDRDEDWFEMKWFYMSMGVGFAVGFWPFWGVIVLKKSWRIAYFRFLDDMKEKIF